LAAAALTSMTKAAPWSTGMATAVSAPSAKWIGASRSVPPCSAAEIADAIDGDAGR